MRMEAQQLKVQFPAHLYQLLQGESAVAGVTMASLVRLAVVFWYERRGVTVEKFHPNGKEEEEEIKNE